MGNLASTPLGRLWKRRVVKGVQEWTRNGRLHRDGDKPARIFPDGRYEWYVDGRLHRDGDKPAAVWWFDDYIALVWKKNGQTHRDGDRPAYMSSNGVSKWCVYGKLIRIETRCAFANNCQRFEFVAACLQF